MMSPTGKKQEPMDRMRPGALVWYHGAVSVERATAQLYLPSAMGVAELVRRSCAIGRSGEGITRTRNGTEGRTCTS